MKNKNNSLFNIGLYIDALKQLRLIGFISFGIISAISVIIMAGRTMDMEYYGSTPVVVTTLATCIQARISKKKKPFGKRAVAACPSSPFRIKKMNSWPSSIFT